MPDRHDEHEQHFVFDLIDNSVIAGSNPVKILGALNLVSPARPRVLGEFLDFPRNLLLVSVRKPGELSLG